MTDAPLGPSAIAENLKVWTKTSATSTTAPKPRHTAAGFAEQLDVDRLHLALSSPCVPTATTCLGSDVVVNALYKPTMRMLVKRELNLADDLPTLLARYTDTND
ncbi:MAG: hypothetical protein IPM98_15650 [Lewinellaceae bacterium]|nr:hypothetical protein [Lewinellaceae bacterium]